MILVYRARAVDRWINVRRKKVLFDFHVCWTRSWRSRVWSAVWVCVNDFSSLENVCIVNNNSNDCVVYEQKMQIKCWFFKKKKIVWSCVYLTVHTFKLIFKRLLEMYAIVWNLNEFFFIFRYHIRSVVTIAVSRLLRCQAITHTIGDDEIWWPVLCIVIFE